LTVVFVAFTLNLSWGLKGIAVGVLVSRIVEFFVKLVPLLPWLKRTKAVPLPEDLRRRLLGFSGRGTGLMLLSIVIWDRSDMVILKLLQSDIRQLAFFSVSLSLVDRLMILPQAFGRALSASQMFESGRDKQRLLGITATAARYTLLGSLPLLLGGACISGSAIQIIYGHQYLSAIPVFRLAALFAIPRAMLAPASSLLYSLEDIGFILSWNCICAAIEIAVDIALIPHYAAMGAAIGNGIGQTLAALGVWSRAVLHFGVDLHFPRLAKITLAAVAMAAAVLFTTRTITSDVVKSIVGVMVGALTFAAALRLTSALGRDDHDRMNVLVRRLPAPFQDSAGRIVQFLCSMGMKMEP
jgi:O-antigen/teichoic acid export membrane protein